MMTGTNVGLSGRSRAGAGEGVVKRDYLPDDAGEGWHLSAGSGRRYVTGRYAPRQRTQDCVGWSGPNVGV